MVVDRGQESAVNHQPNTPYFIDFYDIKKRFGKNIFQIPAGLFR
jgi:hypothetical protein